MYLSMITVLCLITGQISVEAAGGMALPGSPESDTPALDMDLRLKTEIAPHWCLFISGSFWKLENFNPTDAIPEFAAINPVFGYDAYAEYSDSHRGIQLGVEKTLGPVFLEMAGGMYSRTVMIYISGDIDGRTGEERAKDSGFLGSFAVGIPAGDYGILRLGTRTEGLEDWFITASAGVTIDIPSFGGEAQ